MAPLFTYMINMAFKNDSSNSCMHIRETKKGVPALTFSENSGLFIFLRKIVVNMTNVLLWSFVYVQMCNSCMHNILGGHLELEFIPSPVGGTRVLETAE